MSNTLVPTLNYFVPIKKVVYQFTIVVLNFNVYSSQNITTVRFKFSKNEKNYIVI